MPLAGRGRWVWNTELVFQHIVKKRLIHTPTLGPGDGMARACSQVLGVGWGAVCLGSTFWKNEIMCILAT